MPPPARSSVPACPIVFDLDGTLIDSLPDLHAALNVVLRAEGLPAVTAAQTRGFIGHGIPNLVRAARRHLDHDPAREPGMIAAMFAAYLAAPTALTRPYPGAVATLDRLSAAGHALGLCTNKAMAPTQAILRDLDLARFFGVVIAGDSLPEKKPDPAPLRAAFATLGGPGLFVGDSEVDCEAALNAGVPFALFTPGYRKAAPEALPHVLAFDDYAEFPDRLATLAPGLAPAPRE